MFDSSITFVNYFTNFLSLFTSDLSSDYQELHNKQFIRIKKMLKLPLSGMNKVNYVMTNHNNNLNISLN